HLEERPSHDAGLNGSRLAESRHGEAGGGEVAEGAERLGARAQIADLRHRKGDIGAAFALAEVDKAIFVAVDEREQQATAQKAEYFGVGADAEGQGEDDSYAEAFGADQGAGAEFSAHSKRRQTLLTCRFPLAGLRCSVQVRRPRLDCGHKIKSLVFWAG